MSNEIIVALITGGLSLAGVVFTSIFANRRTTNEVTHRLEMHQAVTEAKLESLREEVHKHNGVVERTFRLEGRMTEAEHDIKDLKAYHKPSA